MQGFLLRLVLNVIGLAVADALLSGVSVDGAPTFFLAAIILGFVNAVIRPIAILFTLPLTVLTLGLFLWAINGAMLMLTASLVDGFQVTSFGTALIGSALISLVGGLGSWFIGPAGRVEVMMVQSDRRD